MATTSPPTPTSALNCTRTICSILKMRCPPLVRTAPTRQNSRPRSSWTVRRSWMITGPANSRVPASARARTMKFSCWSLRADIRLRAFSAQASTTAPRFCSSTSACRLSTSTAAQVPCCGSTANTSRSRRPLPCATPAAARFRTHGSIKSAINVLQPSAPAGGCVVLSALMQGFPSKDRPF